MKLSVFLWVTCALVALYSNSLGQTSAFTYQGSLQSSGSPANGSFDFEFALFDALSGGNQIAFTVPANAVAVTNGTFAVTLNFGTSPFDASNRYLEIRVRPQGSGSFTVLAPRHQITSSPYSVQTIRAQFADNAGSLAGVPASDYVKTNDARLSDARPPTAGSTSYIQNGTSPQASSDFNITGTGNADILNAETEYQIRGLKAFRISTNSTMSVGIGAGHNNTGDRNTFVGTSAGSLTTSGALNTYVGYFAGGTNNGNGNVIVGGYQVLPLSPSNDNSYFGTISGQNSIGNSNSFFGHSSGLGNITGSLNTAFGAGASFSVGDLTNAAAIGSRAYVGQSNSMVLGSINGVNGATADTNVGIGTTSPTFRFHVRANGQDGIKIQHTGTGGFPQVRWTDSNDVFKASIGVDTSGTGNMNMFVNGADRMILKSNGVVQVPGPLFINNPNTVVITSPNGACWGITVSNTGVLSTFPVNPCP